MRKATSVGLLIPAALGAGLGLALVSCHKQPPPQVKAASATPALRLESYDPVAPMPAPSGPRLTTMAPQSLALAQIAPVGPSAADPVEAPAETLPPPLPRHAYAPAQIPDQSPGESRPASGRYIDAPAAGAYRPGDQGAADVPEPPGFRLTVRICRAAARQSDPLAQTPECQGMLQAARDQQEACARAFEAGDDEVVLSPACRQAAMDR